MSQKDTDLLDARTSDQFVTARTIAERWSCHVDTVYSRLNAAGIPTYRFTARLVRWRWADVFFYEDSLVGKPVLASHLEPEPTSRKRGPQRLRVSADD